MERVYTFNPSVKWVKLTRRYAIGEDREGKFVCFWKIRYGKHGPSDVLIIRNKKAVWETFGISEAATVIGLMYRSCVLSSFASR